MMTISNTSDCINYGDDFIHHALHEEKNLEYNYVGDDSSRNDYDEDKDNFFRDINRTKASYVAFRHILLEQNVLLINSEGSYDYERGIKYDMTEDMAIDMIELKAKLCRDAVMLILYRPSKICSLLISPDRKITSSKKTRTKIISNTSNCINYGDDFIHHALYEEENPGYNYDGGDDSSTNDYLEDKDDFFREINRTKASYMAFSHILLEQNVLLINSNGSYDYERGSGIKYDVTEDMAIDMIELKAKLCRDAVTLALKMKKRRNRILIRRNRAPIVAPCSE